jgi:hypothetical protein
MRQHAIFVIAAGAMIALSVFFALRPHHIDTGVSHLRHKFCQLPPQQGHLGSVLTSTLINRTRTVAIEFRHVASGRKLVSQPKSPFRVVLPRSARSCFGGRTRARTWDPLIKRHAIRIDISRQFFQLSQNPTISDQRLTAKNPTASMSWFAD